MHASEGGFDAGNVDSHRFYAILATVGSTVVWVLRARGGPSVLGLAKFAGLVTFAAMLLTLHFGSRLTHGERFLSVAAAPASASSTVAAVAGDSIADPTVLALIETLAQHGLQARQEARMSTRLSIAPVAPGTKLDAAAIAAIGAAAGAVTELSLSRAVIPDGALATVAALPSLSRLRLDNLALDDRAVAVLAPLASLEVLNLYGNSAITNASIDAIAALPALERVYLWGSSIDAAGLDALAAARPDLTIEGAEAFPTDLVANAAN
jgi:hypothetical protein